MRVRYSLLALTACNPGLQPKSVECGDGTVRDGLTCIAADDTAAPPVDDPNDTDIDDTDTDDTDTDTDDTDTDEPADSGDTDDPVPSVVHVYLLGGQSNMVGVGPANTLAPDLRTEQPDVFLYWADIPMWRGLQPSSTYTSGFGTFFGPEMLFGRTMADASDVPVYLIKHAVGGTNLAVFWHPGDSPSDPTIGDGYRVFSQTAYSALAELDATGVEYEIKGMIWMQGEADATNPDWAAAYEANLTHFIDRVRTDFDAPDMPFVAAQIDCRGLCLERDTVNAAFEAVAAADPLVSTFTTEDVPRFPWDGWHYDGFGQRVLGERFAAAFTGTPAPEPPEPAIVLTGSYTYDYYGDYTVGWRFRTTQFIEVTDLGLFDLFDDGLSHGPTVGIWDFDTQSLLVTADVPEGTFTDWEGGFRYVGCEPTLLPPGDYIIGVEAFERSPDYYIYMAQTEVDASIEFVEARHHVGNSLTFPTLMVETTTDAAAWLGPNLRFRVAE